MRMWWIKKKMWFKSRFERCALCGWFLRLWNELHFYYGGIDDKKTGKTYYVCMRCYDWFNNNKLYIEEGVINKMPKTQKFKKMESAMKKTYGKKRGKNIASATAKKRGMKA